MRVTYSISLFIAAIVALSSCKNNDNVIAPVISTAITVVNASADTLNFYLNGTRQNNSSFLFPTGSAVNQVVPAGSQNYQFKKAGGFSVLFSVPLNLVDSTYNSLYVTGETPDASFHTADALPVVSTSLTSDTAFVRFVNAAPDAGNLNAGITNIASSSTVAFNTIAFKSSAAFKILLSGQNEIKIYQDGSTSPKVDTTISFLPNHVYTLFTKGLVSGKGNAAFNVGILVNY